MNEKDQSQTQNIITVTSEQPGPNLQGDHFLENSWEPLTTHYDNGQYGLAHPQEEEIGIHGHFTLTRKSAKEPQQTETVHIIVFKPNYYRDIAGVIVTQNPDGTESEDFMQGTISVDQTRLPGPNNFTLTHTRNVLVNRGLPPSGEFDIT